MTLEQLRIFVAVAERQHMTRAAEALNLTQQAVSSAIVALENAYSVPLFHRWPGIELYRSLGPFSLTQHCYRVAHLSFLEGECHARTPPLRAAHI
jgi:regulatory helix-turn-helix LysR family protein